MEKTWENFWDSGKVTDYLKYKNSLRDDEKEKREQDSDVTGGNSDRHGIDGDAYRRV